MAKTDPIDMKLEVVILGVSDVDRAKAFYENLGWRLDIDVAHGDFRGVQLTPHTSGASIIFGNGVTSAQPGSTKNLVLAVDDIDVARNDLMARGVEVSEVRQTTYTIITSPAERETPACEVASPPFACARNRAWPMRSRVSMPAGDRSHSSPTRRGVCAERSPMAISGGASWAAQPWPPAPEKS